MTKKVFPPEWYAAQAARRKKAVNPLKKGHTSAERKITIASFDKKKTRTWKDRVMRHQVKPKKGFTGISGTNKSIKALAQSGKGADARQLAQDMAHLKSIMKGN